MRRLLATQLVVFAVAEGANIAVRHYMVLLHRYWIVQPILYVRDDQHSRYSFLFLSGFAGRVLFGGVGVAVLLIFVWQLREYARRDSVVPLLAGLMMGGISVNTFEIVVFGGVTDFIGLRVPPFGSEIVNIADVALGLGLVGFGIVWLRPTWLRPRWKLLTAMSLGTFVFLVEPVTAILKPAGPPTAISSSVAGATVGAAAQKQWGSGISINTVFSIHHCLVYHSDCQADSAWLWEVDVDGKSKFTWQGHATTDSAVGYVDYETGKFLGFALPY